MLTVTGLWFDHERTPVGLDHTPVFGWQLEGNCRNIRQTQYRLQVALTPDFAALLYDETCETGNSTAVHAAGLTLQSLQKYYARVQVWADTAAGPQQTLWSEPAVFITALLDPAAEWKAEFVSAESPETCRKSSAGTMVRAAFTVKPGLRAAYACTTALGLYNVYLNGQKVSTDEMTPGWTSYNRRLLYQTYEVTAMLHPGLNMAGGMLGAGWYKGVMGLTRSRNNYGDTTAFAMVNGFKGVLVQQMDPETGALLGERRKVYSGSGIGCTEGPRIYHIGSWYYLVVAEGGTGYSHCVTIARSDNVFGPYETMPDNPLLTSDQNDLTAIQKCGHGSFVKTQNGEWYMAHLCSRPNSARGSLLGRETALQKITWQDGWPRLACGGKIAQNAVPAPKDLPEVELPAMAEQDDFDVPALAPGYATPRTPLGDCVNLTVRPGWLRLTGQESMNSLHHVTLVARRQQEHEMQAETRMDFAPVCPEQMAGFTYCYDSMNFYLLGKTCAEDGTPVLELLKSDTGVVEDVCDPVPVPDGTLDFKLTTTPDGGMAQFYYRQPQGEWQSIGPACPTDILTDEHCRGFTGAHVGVYAHDMAGLHNHADFDYLNVHFER